MIQSLLRSMELLEVLKEKNRSYTIAELSDHVNLPPQSGVGGAGSETEIPGTAFCIEAAGNGDGFQKCGLAGTVFAHKKSDIF